MEGWVEQARVKGVARVMCEAQRPQMTPAGASCTSRCQSGPRMWKGANALLARQRTCQEAADLVNQVGCTPTRLSWSAASDWFAGSGPACQPPGAWRGQCGLWAT